MTKVQSYYIIAGWAEGSKLSFGMGRELEKRGLVKAKKVGQANIIIGHSAGCYMLPHKVSAQVIFLIGAPYWPGRSIVRRVFNNVVTDAPAQIKSWDSWRFLHNRLWNTAYIMARPFRTIKAWRSLRRMLVGLHDDSKIIIIRSSQDSFCSPDVRLLADECENVSFREVEGLHEDCWHNPGLYVDLIIKELLLPR
ncbi:MAG: hypothetical protein WD887_02325 [Candidatus Saccharimonadales bacterium]